MVYAFENDIRESLPQSCKNLDVYKFLCELLLVVLWVKSKELWQNKAAVPSDEHIIKPDFAATICGCLDAD
jgi:hypothetical protein